MIPSGPLFERPFFFLRHGESVANRAGQVAGRTDPPLTQRGHGQARDAAVVLAEHGIRSIHASAARRAVDTAKPLAELLDLTVNSRHDLWERDWGDYEGRPMSIITDRSVTPPGGEGLAAFEDRVLGALGAIDGPWPALIVAHSGTLRVLRARLGTGDIPPSIDNALPLRADPPHRPSEPWRITPLIDPR